MLTNCMKPSCEYNLMSLLARCGPKFLSCLIYLYNNTPSKAIVNAASNITHRPVIEADDTGR